MQEAKNPAYGATLEAKRQEDHDSHLTFVAVSYEKQRKEGRLAVVEHPWSAKSWDTFNRTQGYDARVDVCEYGLVLPDDEGVINPVQKPTRLRVTSPMVHYLLWKECSGDHWHTHLEGYALGLGARTSLAENYTQMFATAVVNESMPFWHTWTIRTTFRRLMTTPTQPTRTCLKTGRLLRQSQFEPTVNFEQRSEAELWNMSSACARTWAMVLTRMLKEVQATSDVLEAAQKYVCPMCYARKGPKQPCISPEGH